MKQLSIEEQARVMGGYDEEKCREVQELAALYAQMQANGMMVPGGLWDDWETEFLKYCV